MPWEGVDMLRILSPFRASPHALGSKAMLQVPEKSLLFTHIVLNLLVIVLGLLPLLAGTSLIWGTLGITFEYWGNTFNWLLFSAFQCSPKWIGPLTVVWATLIWLRALLAKLLGTKGVVI